MKTALEEGVGMNRKRAIDWAIVLVSMSLLLIACVYPQHIRQHIPLICLSGILAVIFLVMAIKDGRPDYRREIAGWEKESARTALATEIVLLSEEETELCIWDIYGKTAVVIGRDIKENQVDIDLSNSPYASMVDIEHAVMNYSLGSWYVEDLGSKNGIKVKKAMDGKTYQLSADTPCKLECGDVLYVGLNRLLLR